MNRIGSLSQSAVAITAAVVAVLALAATPAFASQAYRLITNNPGGFAGSRATITSPDATTVILGSGNFFLSSVYADDYLNGSNAIQQGITDEYNKPQQPTCDLGYPYPELYYFAETIQGTTGQCYNEGTASFSHSDLNTVDITGPTYWKAYLNGTYKGVEAAWNSNCGVYACDVAAFGEEGLNEAPGYWQSIFAGSGLTPWQYYNGTSWMEVGSATPALAPYWTANGSFPSSWNFTYSH